MKSLHEIPFSFPSIVRETTEYEWAKEGLLEDSHRLHTLMDNLPDLIYFKDRESHFTRINLALANEFKLSHPDQAVGKSDFDFFTEEHAQEAYKHEQEIIRMGQPMVDKEEKQTWTDGHVTWVSNTKMPLRDVNGDIIGTFGLSRDITQRKRAEDAHRDSEEKYRSLVSNIPDVVWTVDDQFRFAFIGSNVEKLTGFSQEEVYEKGAQIYLDFLHPDDVHRVREGFRALIAESQPFDVDCRLKRKDGEWIWVHDRAIATYEKNGIRYADGLISDITARKRAEAEMAERHRLATLVAETGVVLTRAESLHQGLQQCAEILVRNIGAAFARVWTLNDEESVLELQASAGIYTHLDGGHARLPIGKFKIGRIAESGESHLTNSVQEDPWVGDPEWARRECMVAFAGYPLKVDGRVLGVVAAFARHPLTETTLQAFASVADNIAQFIKRKRAEQQSQFQTAALESAANGIVIASREGRIIWVNPAFTRLTGYPACEVIGENPRFLKSGVHDEVFYQKLWKTILSGETWQGEIVNRRKDGTLYTEEMTITPVCEAAGTIHHFIAIKQDITARKRAEESLRHSEELFRATVENAGVGVALVDLQGRPIKSNPALRQMLGYSDEELGRMAFTEFTHPDDRELDWGLFSELAAGKREKYEIEKRFLKKSGGVVWGLLTVSLVKGGDGRSVGAVGMVQDITERKRAEEEMYESRQMLQIILDTIPQRVFWKDRNLSYSGCNQAFATDAGLKDSTEIIDKNDYELAGRETAERYRADDKLVMEQETPDSTLMNRKIGRMEV